MSIESKFFGQHGEDYVLSRLFSDKRDGVYVEVGCIDGRRFSNTLHFELAGWKGVCIEAHNDYIEPLRKNRPSSVVVHAAISDHDEESTNFYANSRGSLSTLDQSKEIDFESYGASFTGFEVQTVPMRSLTSVFDSCETDGWGPIDFMSIDIEGHELKALQGLDFARYRPKVLVVECDSYPYKLKIDKLLKSQGYLFLCAVAINLFYTLDKAHFDIVSGKTFRNVEINILRHPLDSGGDRTVIMDVACNKKYNFDLRNFLRFVWLQVKKKIKFRN